MVRMLTSTKSKASLAVTAELQATHTLTRKDFATNARVPSILPNATDVTLEAMQSAAMRPVGVPTTSTRTERTVSPTRRGNKHSIPATPVRQNLDGRRSSPVRAKGKSASLSNHLSKNRSTGLNTGGAKIQRFEHNQTSSQVLLPLLVTEEREGPPLPDGPITTTRHELNGRADASRTSKHSRRGQSFSPTKQTSVPDKQQKKQAARRWVAKDAGYPPEIAPASTFETLLQREYQRPVLRDTGAFKNPAAERVRLFEKSEAKIAQLFSQEGEDGLLDLRDDRTESTATPLVPDVLAIEQPEPAVATHGDANATVVNKGTQKSMAIVEDAAFACSTTTLAARMLSIFDVDEIYEDSKEITADDYHAVTECALPESSAASKDLPRSRPVSSKVQQCDEIVTLLSEQSIKPASSAPLATPNIPSSVAFKSESTQEAASSVAQNACPSASVPVPSAVPGQIVMINQRSRSEIAAGTGVFHVRLTFHFMNGVVVTRSHPGRTAITDVVAYVDASTTAMPQLQTTSTLWTTSKPLLTPTCAGNVSRPNIVWNGQVLFSMLFQKRFNPYYAEESFEPEIHTLTIGVQRGEFIVPLGKASIIIDGEDLDKRVDMVIRPIADEKRGRGLFSSKKATLFRNLDAVYSLDTNSILRAQLEVKAGTANDDMSTVWQGQTAYTEGLAEKQSTDEIQSRGVPSAGSRTASLDRSQNIQSFGLEQPATPIKFDVNLEGHSLEETATPAQKNLRKSETDVFTHLGAQVTAYVSSATACNQATLDDAAAETNSTEMPEAADPVSSTVFPSQNDGLTMDTMEALAASQLCFQEELESTGDTASKTSTKSSRWRVSKRSQEGRSRRLFSLFKRNPDRLEGGGKIANAPGALFFRALPSGLIDTVNAVDENLQGIAHDESLTEADTDTGTEIGTDTDTDGSVSFDKSHKTESTVQSRPNIVDRAVDWMYGAMAVSSSSSSEGEEEESVEKMSSNEEKPESRMANKVAPPVVKPDDADEWIGHRKLMRIANKLSMDPDELVGRLTKGEDLEQLLLAKVKSGTT